MILKCAKSRQLVVKFHQYFHSPMRNVKTRTQVFFYPLSLYYLWSGHSSHSCYERNYWLDYIDEEMRLGEKIHGDAICIFPDVFTVDDFTAEHGADLTRGLQKLFAYYKDTGIYSFNASLFFAPANQKYFSCHFRIAPRTFLNVRDFASDLNFYQLLFDEPISVVVPEQLCADLVPYFR